jgi:hypothetical protein
VRTPRSSKGYENDSDIVGIADSCCWLSCAVSMVLPWLFAASSFELDSPATFASIPSASDGFCRLENCSSSVVFDDPLVAWSSSPVYCCRADGSCDHVPRLPSAWKLPSSARGVLRGGSVVAFVSGVSPRRGFFRTRRPPRLLPPRTHSRLSRLHRRHGMEPLSSLDLAG